MAKQQARGRQTQTKSETTETDNLSASESKVTVKKVRERDVRVRIRSGPGVNFDHINGEYLGKGTFEIDRVENGVGSMSGWGHLVNGKGWVALDFLDVLE